MYAVIEMQILGDKFVVVTPVHTFADATKTDEENRRDAEAYWHDVMAAAARSGLPCHSATILRYDAQQFAAGHYDKIIPEENK